MSSGWKDTQNFQFGRRRKPPPPPNPVPLWERTLSVVKEALPQIAIPSKAPFPTTMNWSSLENTPHDPTAGGLSGRRADNKRNQIANMIGAVHSVLNHFPPNNDTQPHIVEFCASSGYVALPLTTQYPSSKVTILDAKCNSVEIGYGRLSGLPRKCNIRAVLGTTETFSESFDVGIALHACGEATDAVMDACIRSRAAFVLCPCCVGRISRYSLGYAEGRPPPSPPTERDNHTWDENTESEDVKGIEKAWKKQLCAMREARYDGRPRPRSQILREILDPHFLGSARNFSALAKASDANWSHDQHEDEVVETTNMISKARKDAKRTIDYDRLLYAQAHGYVTNSFTMTPSSCTPKNEVLYGYPSEWDNC